MATTFVTSILLLVIVLGHTGGIDATAVYCGQPNGYSDFNYDVDSVLDGLVAKTSLSESSYLYYPDGTTVGTAMGRANCYRASSDDQCKNCLQYARDGLLNCNYATYGELQDDSPCFMQYWQITA
ncbi:hypothetical protein LINGRAHAP2_LOCUS33722 [Linum grandiflorum]